MSSATSLDPVNTLKIREDVHPLNFRMDGDTVQIGSDPTPAWAQVADFDRWALRARIEPWLTALFQADHLNLLVGSGLTSGIQHLAEATAVSSMSGGHFTEYPDEIAAAAEASAVAAGRKTPNIEDEIRTANQLVRGLEILGKTAESKALRANLDEILRKFADSILTGERALAESDETKREAAFNALVSFLMSFASRTGIRDRLGIFTTNYDRVLEIGAELAGLHLLDRFIGTVTPVFRSSRMDLDLHYNPPGIRGEPRFVEGVARFTKLHGSLDWLNADKSIRRFGLPFGALTIEPYLEAPGLSDSKATGLMIYPNASKDRETAEYPYVELFRDFAAAVARPNTVTVTYGYSFGDEHINRVLQDALTIPSTHLVIISLDDRSARIMDAFDRWGRSAQISLLIGPELADISSLTSRYLPKPSIDLATRRMADLLRQRYSSSSPSTSSSSSSTGGDPL